TEAPRLQVPRPDDVLRADAGHRDGGRPRGGLLAGRGGGTLTRLRNETAARRRASAGARWSRADVARRSASGGQGRTRRAGRPSRASTSRYLPVNRGARLFTNASTASRWSCVAPSRVCAAFSFSNASANVDVLAAASTRLISRNAAVGPAASRGVGEREGGARSEEHTAELQSREKLVCRLLVEKKK